MASMHIHHPLLSVCLCLVSLFTLGTELFSGLSGQTYSEDFSPFVGTGLNTWGQAQEHEVQQGWSYSAQVWRTPLCITWVSGPVLLSMQALVGIVIWPGAPSCFRQTVLYLPLPVPLPLCLYLYIYIYLSICLSAEFEQWFQCKNLLCLRSCWKFVLMESLPGSSSDNNTETILAAINYKRILATVSPYSYFLFFLVFFPCFLQTAPATSVSLTREYNTTVTTLGDTCMVFTIGSSACLFPCHVPIVS